MAGGAGTKIIESLNKLDTYEQATKSVGNIEELYSSVAAQSKNRALFHKPVKLSTCIVILKTCF